MSKTRTNITMDSDLFKTVRDLKMNLSSFVEMKLSEFLNETRPRFHIRCTKCGAETAAQTIINKTKGKCPSCNELIIRPFKLGVEND